MPDNVEKRVPKGNIKFSICLSEEQKDAKSNILNHPFSFILGKAGTKPTDIARLNAESGRYTGRDNIAVAIGLVNGPR